MTGPQWKNLVYFIVNMCVFQFKQFLKLQNWNCILHFVLFDFENNLCRFMMHKKKNQYQFMHKDTEELCYYTNVEVWAVYDSV